MEETEVAKDHSSPAGKMILPYLLLAVIVGVGVVGRLYGFSHDHVLTFDEGLYAQGLGPQLSKDFTDYSSEKIYRAAKQVRSDIPEYLNRPLFKHPPLFPYSIAFMYLLFGASDLAAVSVSMTFGALMIVGVFFLGRKLYDNRVGLYAAFLLSLEPIHWICSEKIWMETTVSFFILLGLLFYVHGRTSGWYLLLSGIAMGLALLTKYSGLLACLIALSFAMLFDRPMLTRRFYWSICAIPLAMFLPWIAWNRMASDDIYSTALKPHDVMRVVHTLWKAGTQIAWAIAVGVLVCLAAYGLRRMNQGRIAKKKGSLDRATVVFVGICVFLVVAIGVEQLRQLVKLSLLWNHTFLLGWENPFFREPWYFYLARMLELSPLYLFTYCGVFLLILGGRRDLFVVWSALWIFIFCMAWGNYQSRYVLPAVPFCMLLGARMQVWLYDQIFGATPIRNPGRLGLARIAILVAIAGFTTYCIARTIRTDLVLGTFNSFAYF